MVILILGIKGKKIMISIRKNLKETIIIQNNKDDIALTRNSTLTIYLIMNALIITLGGGITGFYIYLIPIFFLLGMSRVPKKIYLKVNENQIEIVYFKFKKKIILKDIKEIEKIIIEKKMPYVKGYNKFIYSLKIKMYGIEKTEEILDSIFSQDLRKIKQIILEHKSKGEEQCTF